MITDAERKKYSEMFAECVAGDGLNYQTYTEYLTPEEISVLGSYAMAGHFTEAMAVSSRLGAIRSRSGQHAEH